MYSLISFDKCLYPSNHLSNQGIKKILSKGNFRGCNIPYLDLGGSCSSGKPFCCLSAEISFACWTSYAWNLTVCTFCIWYLLSVTMFVDFSTWVHVAIVCLVVLHSQIRNSHLNGCLGCFQFEAMMNKTAMNTLVHTLWKM